MITITPIGVLTFRRMSPLGRSRSSRIRPTGSGSWATSRNPVAMPATRSSFSNKRSSIARERPISRPVSMSLALASWMRAVLFSSASAIASRQAFLSSVDIRVKSREARFACPASPLIWSLKSMGVTD